MQGLQPSSKTDQGFLYFAVCLQFKRVSSPVTWAKLSMKDPSDKQVSDALMSGIAELIAEKMSRAHTLVAFKKRFSSERTDSNLISLALAESRSREIQ